MLPNTRKLATVLVFAGYAFKLSPLMSKMEAMEDAMGMEYFEIVDSISGGFVENPDWDEDKAAADPSYEVLPMLPDPQRPPKPENLSKLFFHLQDNDEHHTLDQVHEYLFADARAISADEVQKQLASLFFALKGIDYQDQIAKLAAQKKARAKTQPTAT